MSKQVKNISEQALQDYKEIYTKTNDESVITFSEMVSDLNHKNVRENL